MLIYIDHRTVTSIIKQCDVMLQQAKIGAILLNMKTICSTEFSDIDYAVLQFVFLSKSISFLTTQPSQLIEHFWILIKEKRLNVESH